MIRAEEFMGEAVSMGFHFYTGVPCSFLTPLIDCALETTGISYIAAGNEGEAVSIALGASAAGRRAVVMIQNSGVGNAVNPLVSVAAVLRIPVLLICTWRGEPDGREDEPQHQLMGKITAEMFDLMGIPWEVFPESYPDLQPALGRAVRSMESRGNSYALIMRRGAVAPRRSRENVPVADLRFPPADLAAPVQGGACMSRDDALAVIAAGSRDAAVVASTGYISRGLYGTGDSERHLYIVGGMGCASSIGLGLALTDRRRHIVVLDGDGAALMRLGALSTIGHYRPGNLTHVVLDNEAYESTGGQATTSCTTDLAVVAAGCGYPRVLRVKSADELGEAVAGRAGQLTFIHLKIQLNNAPPPPRPDIHPAEVATRFGRWFARSQSPSAG